MFKKPIKALDSRKVKKFSRVDFSVCQKLNRDLITRAAEIKDAKEKKEYQEFLRLKKKFEGDKK